MQHISSHFNGTAKKTERATERGELMQYFIKELNKTRAQDKLPLITMGRMGRLFMAIPTKDLYYLKSVCDQAPNFSKKFWWEINPKKHTPEALAKAALKNTLPRNKSALHENDYE